MKINAQVSVYPLRQPHLGPAIDVVRKSLEKHQLAADVGPVSTFVTGESDDLFSALREAFDRDADRGDVVMTVTIAKAR
jgi:uncharacterized protein YqgV (UPF0045/DUF77 family)